MADECKALKRRKILQEFFCNRAGASWTRRGLHLAPLSISSKSVRSERGLAHFEGARPRSAQRVQGQNSTTSLIEQFK
eukprot:9844418-Heterocapsa_arctica.AAC.1